MVGTPHRPPGGAVAADLYIKDESDCEAAGSEASSLAAVGRSSHRHNLRSPGRLSNKQIQPTAETLNKTKLIYPPSMSSSPTKNNQIVLTSRRKPSSFHQNNEESNRASDNSLTARSSSRKNRPTRNNNGVQGQPQRHEASGPRKSVSFKKLDLEGPSIRHIEPLKSLHKRDIGRRWVSSKEFRNIHVMAAQHLDCQTPESTNFSARGLERLTAEGMDRFLQTRREALFAVLQQQHQCPPVAPQREELIASAYRSETSDAQQRAHQRGQLDALAVQNYLKDDRSAVLERVRQEHRRSMTDLTNGESKSKGLLLQRLISSFRV